MAEAAENWIRRGQTEGLERSTLKQYREDVTLHVNLLLGGMKLSRLTAAGIRDFRDKPLEKLSRPRVKKVLTSPKSILAHAQQRGEVAQNVAAGVKPSRLHGCQAHFESAP